MDRNGGVVTRDLGECGVVSPGFSLSGRIRHHPAGTHQLVLTRHLIEGEPYSYTPADELRITPDRDASRYLVRPGNVLFMARGTRNLAWAIAQVPELTLAPVSFYILRPDPGIDPGYLAWYLNQPPAQAAIAGIRTGAATPLVQRTDFERIPIALPPLEVQRRIGHLGRLMARERELCARLAAATSRAHARAGAEIVRGLLGRAHPNGATDG